MAGEGFDSRCSGSKAICKVLSDAGYRIDEEKTNAVHIAASCGCGVKFTLNERKSVKLWFVKKNQKVIHSESCHLHKVEKETKNVEVGDPPMFMNPLPE
jgi:hypothetical protein